MESVHTPRKTYFTEDRCVLCGIPFVLTSVTSSGRKLTNKQLQNKLKLNDEKLYDILHVLPDFSLLDFEKVMGICLKCHRKVKHVLKTEAENVETRRLLSESRQRVLLDRRVQTEKRMLNSPSGQPLKQPMIAKIQVVKKVCLKSMCTLTEQANVKQPVLRPQLIQPSQLPHSLTVVSEMTGMTSSATMGTRNMTPNGYPSVSWTDTLDLQRSALRWDIKRTMKSLCNKLEEIGEECFVVTVNVHNGWVGHIGSIRGDEYMDMKSHIMYDFLNFCDDSLDKEDLVEDEDSDTDAPLFPTVDDKSEEQSAKPISVSLRQRNLDNSIRDNSPDDDERVSVEIPERYKNMKFPESPPLPAQDVSTEKYILLTVGSSISQLPIMLQQPARKPPSVIRQLPLNPQTVSQLTTENATSDSLEKGVKRKRKQTLQKKPDDDNDKDKNYRGHERSRTPSSSSCTSTRLLRSSSTSKKEGQMTKHNNLDNGDTDDSSFKGESSDVESETETGEDYEVDDSEDEDWVETRKHRRYSSPRGRANKSGISEQSASTRYRTRNAYKHQNADPVLLDSESVDRTQQLLLGVPLLNPSKTRSANKCHNVSDLVTSECDDKKGQEFHIEPLTEMKFVISKGVLEEGSERSHDEEVNDLQPGGELSQTEEPEAAVELIDDDKVDSERSNVKSAAAEKGASGKKGKRK